MAEAAWQPEDPLLQFGPVSERVVNALGEGKGGEGLDLAGGKLVDVPKEFAQWSAQQQKNGVRKITSIWWSDRFTAERSDDGSRT